MTLLFVAVSPDVAAGAVDLKFDFQPPSATTAVGFTPDYGEGYSASTGRGWVREETIGLVNHTPLDLTTRTRARWGNVAVEDNTLIHTATAPPEVRGAFEVAVPNGFYRVTLGLGDPTNYDSSHYARVEGSPLATNVVLTAANPVARVAGVFEVTDGRLTIDSVGGTNTKFTWVTIADAPADSTPPAAPRSLTADAGLNQITLNWLAGTESDLAGYRVYRSTTAVASTSSPLASGSSLLTATSFIDNTVALDVSYSYVVTAVDRAGNESPVSSTVTAAAQAPPPTAFVSKVNFQPAGAPTPAGFIAETGAAFSSSRGYGFVREDSLNSAVHASIDVAERTRRRWISPDLKTDTLVHLNRPGVDVPAAWEAAVPVGDYTVTVAAGDPQDVDSVHRIQVEGQPAIAFTPTAANWSTVQTTTVRVEDGRLTVSGIGGTNNKLLFVEIAATTSGPDTTPPAAPNGVVSTADVNGIHLSWAANKELDVAGYEVFRSTDLPVDVSGTPLSGATPISGRSFTDTTALPGTEYHYVVVALDSSGNASNPSATVTDRQPSIPVDLKFNFQPQDAPGVSGFTKESGQAFSLARGWGWVRQDSLDGDHVPLDMVNNTRDRQVIADQRLDTLTHMQLPAGSRGTQTPGAFEAVVPNGAYDVTVSVGDPQDRDSTHAINVEGQSAISEFFPTGSAMFKEASITVIVSDGRLTVDAIGGKNTKLNSVTIRNADAGARPSVGAVSPADGATGVARGRAITAEVHLPNLGAGIASSTISEDSIRLERVSDGSSINVNRNTSGGGDVIVVQPRAPLEADTQYRFVVTAALKDVSGASFIPKTTTFTTGSSTNVTSNLARFTKSPQAAGTGELMASMAVGPDHRLYATTLDGKILRFPIGASGALGDPTTISTVINHENGPRQMIGLAFDPASTASNPILWVSHGHPAFANAPDWTGKISRLSGANLSTITDYVTELPRSVRDHMTNSLAFGPDGALYLTQGSNSATGQTDTQWGMRPEHALSAAVLRVDTKAIMAPPLDVKTDDGGSYDPFAAGAPVTVYGSGVRNAYDLVFHTNGQLYVPVNGSAASGNLPASPSPLPSACSKRIDAAANGPFTGPAVSGATSIGVQPDLLFRVQKGGYYGHPNPSRCEYTFFGGNPTSAADPLDVPQYPVGTQPDRNYRKPSWNFGNHFSPNGVIEYRGSKFGGALEGKLLVTRYSAGDDVVVLDIDPSTKEVDDQVDGVPGLGGLNNPLDITEDTTTGNLYVNELPDDSAPRIVLMTPDESAGTPRADVSPSTVIDNAVATASSGNHEITLRNGGNAALRLTGISLTGADASQFSLSGLPPVPQAIDPDAEVSLKATFSPTSTGIKTAEVRITTNDPVNPTRVVRLRGLGTAGLGGDKEPSLQRILDLHEIKVNVGDDDPDTNVLPAGASLGQEVPVQALRKAGSGKVTIDPLAVFAKEGPGSAVGAFGWNPVNDAADRSTIGSVPNASFQSVQPALGNALSFDPGSSSFGLWASWAGFDYRTVYSEDALNTPLAGAPAHLARGYELRDASGAVVPDAYVVTFEDLLSTGSQDFQDLVYVIRNVQAEGSGAGRIQLQNLDGQPFDDRLAFNRIGSLTSPPSNGVHDRATVRIRNTGAESVKVTGLPVTGPFQLVSAPALPATITAGGSIDVTVRFIATSGRVQSGTLTVQSDAALTPSTRVDLGGYWQSQSENQQEPNLEEIVNGVFGYGTKIRNAGQAINGLGRVQAIGDEVLSPYWRQLDPEKAVRVTQLAAFHTQGDTAGFRWFMRGGDLKRLALVHAGVDAQSVLPRLNGSSTSLASATFGPTAQFGIAIDGESSDPTMNNQTQDRANGCTGACGHHVRFWPAKTPAGQIITGAYVVSMDYSGINYDYNDNVYLLTNVTPDVDDQHVLYRLNAGSSSDYTDRSGKRWAADTGRYSPSTAPNEGGANATIANTQDDPLFGTYRGNIGNVPQTQRVLDYRLPLATATKVDVRLFFAERYWNSANQRRFDVSAEGVVRLSNVDIFSRAGGKDVAYSTALRNVAVTDGILDLSFAAKADFPAISGIEVLCVETCGTD